MQLIRATLIVSGRVRKVGYRLIVEEKALGLGVKGTVENMPDGRVRIVCEGEKEKIDELNKKYFNKKINKIFFKNHKSKWGSCSSNNNINISTRLLFAPEPVMDYVCIHELAHLVEKNHSGKFWNLVEKAMPDYKDKIKWLRDNGDNCNF